MNSFKVHEHGQITLLDTLPSSNLDLSIAQAAWVDPTRTPKDKSELERIIRYMMRHSHTSPFEQVEFKFHITLPIFVERQWARHRTASWNEISGRYKQLSDNYYVPKEVRARSETRKQGSEGLVEEQAAFLYKGISCSHTTTFNDYHLDLANGIAPELARINLPLSTYTEKIWKIDLHNLLHFLKLRLASDAQQEIRDYAQVILKIIEPLVPVTIQAWKDYKLNAVTFSVEEQEALVHLIKKGSFSTDNIKNQSEKDEFRNKLEKLLDQELK